MKTNKLAAILAGFLFSAAACAGDWYANINTGVNRAEVNSGGYNTAGGFPNTGSDHDSTKLGLLGFSVGRSYGNVRVEAEMTGRKSDDFTTNSFAPPTPTFFYKTRVQTHSLMVNAFYDFPINNQWSAFAGAGLGGAGIDMKTDDTVVSGSGTEINFAWQGMVGATYSFDKSNGLNFGYRYFDPGEATITLDGGSSGNYKANLTYHEFFVGWRHSL